MLRNQDEVNEEIIIGYIRNNQVEKLKEWIEKDPSILKARRLDLSTQYEDAKFTTLFTVAEFVLLSIQATDKILNYILEKISDEELKSFLNENIEFHLKSHQQTTALHFISLNYDGQCARAIIDKLTNPSFNFDSLLMKANNCGTNSLMLTYRNHKDPSVWKQYFSAVTNKKEILCSKTNTQWSLLNFALRYRKNKDDIATILNALDDQTAADLILSVLGDGNTGLHQAMEKFNDVAELDPDTIQLILQKLASNKKNKQRLLTAFFYQKNKNNDTPYALAKKYHRYDSILFILNQFDVDDIKGADAKLKELIKDREFQKHIELASDSGFFISTLSTTTKDPEIMTYCQKHESWRHRKTMLEVISGLKAKEWKLDEDSEEKLNRVMLSIGSTRRGSIFQTILKLFGSHPDRITGFKELELNKDNKRVIADYPEIIYLYAFCHQHAIGVSRDDEKAIEHYDIAYGVIGKQIKNTKDVGLIAYLNHFKQKIMQALKAYFEYPISDAAKYSIAMKYSNLLLLEKEWEKCREFLAVLNESKTDRYDAIKAMLYYELSKNQKDDSLLDKAIELNYGPAYQAKADKLINGTPPDLEAVADKYYQAITTTVMPQVDAGIDGIRTCLQRNGTSDQLKSAENLVTFIDQKITLDNPDWKKYKAFLDVMKQPYHYVPAHWALYKKQDVSKDKKDFYSNLMLVAVGEKPQDNNFIPKNSDLSSAKQHAETAIRRYLENKAVVIESLRGLKEMLPTSFQKTCGELLTRLENPKQQIEGPNKINDSTPLHPWQSVIGQMKEEMSAQNLQVQKQLAEQNSQMEELSQKLDATEVELNETKLELGKKIFALEKATEEQTAVKEENGMLKKEMAEVKEENDQLKEEIGHLREDLRFSGSLLAVSRRIETWRKHFSIYAPTENEVKNDTDNVNESDNNSKNALK